MYVHVRIYALYTYIHTCIYIYIYMYINVSGQFAERSGPDLELVTCSGHAKNGALCVLQVTVVTIPQTMEIHKYCKSGNVKG